MFIIGIFVNSTFFYTIVLLEMGKGIRYSYNVYRNNQLGDWASW